MNFLDDFDLRDPDEDKHDMFKNLFRGNFEPTDLSAPRDESSITSDLTDEDPYADPMTDQYLSHLRQKPRRDEHKSSTGRKIGGTVLQALLGTDFGVTDKPYNEATRDWKDSGSGLAEGANFEQKGLVERRRRLKDMMAKQKNDRNYMRQIEDNDRNYELKKKKLLEIDMPKEARQKLEAETDREHAESRIKLRRAWQDAMIPLAQSRDNRAEKALSLRQDQPMAASAQKNIDTLAAKEVARDPRFNKWFDANEGGFADILELDALGKPKLDKSGEAIVKEKLPSSLAIMIKRALAEAKNRIANRKKNEYISPYGSDSLDQEDMDTPLRFGNEEEEEEPF